MLAMSVVFPITDRNSAHQVLRSLTHLKGYDASTHDASIGTSYDSDHGILA